MMIKIKLWAGTYMYCKCFQMSTSSTFLFYFFKPGHEHLMFKNSRLVAINVSLDIHEDIEFLYIKYLLLLNIPHEN